MTQGADVIPRVEQFADNRQSQHHQWRSIQAMIPPESNGREHKDTKPDIDVQRVLGEPNDSDQP